MAELIVLKTSGQRKPLSVTDVQEGAIKIGDWVTCESWGADLDGSPYVCRVIDIKKYKCNSDSTAFFEGGGFWSLSPLVAVSQEPEGGAK